MADKDQESIPNIMNKWPRLVVTCRKYNHAAPVVVAPDFSMEHPVIMFTDHHTMRSLALSFDDMNKLCDWWKTVAP